MSINSFSRTRNDQVEFTIQEPGYYSFKDDLNIIIGPDLYVEPNDTLTVSFYKRDGLIWIDAEGKKSANNTFYSLMYDSVLAIIKYISKARPLLASRDEVSKTTDSLIKAKIYEPLRAASEKNNFSQDFYKHVYLPQLKSLNTYFKNLILEKHQEYKTWPMFFDDSIMLNPNIKFWSRNYMEEPYFEIYLYKHINQNKAVDLNNFITNIEKNYPVSENPELNHTAIARGLKVFFNYYIPSDNYQAVVYEADSIIKKHGFEKNKMILPSYMQPNSGILTQNLLDSITLFDFTEGHIKLSKVVNDTSRIYYIDHWASWCKPCIEEIPKSILLQKEYSEKLQIIYLSNDKKHPAFVQAINRLKMPENNTYRVDLTNAEEAYRKLNSSVAIPIYQFLFYKNSRWYVTSAARPSDNFINAQIEGLKLK